MTAPEETARLLGWMPTVARWSELTPEERRFCIGMRANEKRNPAYQPSEGAVRWMQKLVSRFQDATLKEEPADGDHPQHP